MPFSLVRPILCAALVHAIAPDVAAAQNCRIDIRSGKCIFIAAGQRTPPDFAVGDEFPIYEHNMLLDIDRYDLPPVDGPWRYYKSGFDIYKVDVNTNRVLDILRRAAR